MDPRSLNVLSLCTGIGGLELGLRLAGVPARTVCVVEREAFGCACLEAAMRAGAMDEAPIWTDLIAFDGEPWRGVVDLITAGFPCQPWSVAGQRKGTDDERWIWPDIARIVREVGPRYVFLENVPGLLTSGLGHVLGDLAACGFDAEWDVFSAGALGAGHTRERLFILAYRDEQRGQRLRGLLDGERETQRDDPDRCRGERAEVGHTQGSGLEERRGGGWGEERQPRLEYTGPPPFPPGPADREAWARVLDRWPWLAPAVADSESGEPRIAEAGNGREGAERAGDGIVGDEEEAQPPVRGVADGLPARVDQLRALGNGVVPVVAAYAFRTLSEKFTPSW